MNRSPAVEILIQNLRDQDTTRAPQPFVGHRSKDLPYKDGIETL